MQNLSDSRFGESEPVYSRVLVGVGGSERSYVALRYALELARQGTQPLRALVVRTPPAGSVLALGSVPGYREWLDDAARLARRSVLAIEAEIHRLAEECGAPVSVEHATGMARDCLVEAAVSASCLVMGKRGHSGAHGGLLGSNTELVVRRTRIPILLTPQKYVAPVRVTAAYAAKEAGASVLSHAVELSRLYEAPLHLLTVARDRARLVDVQKRGREELAARGHTAILESHSGRVADEIVAHARPETVLVMGAYGHARVYRMVLGSVTEEVIRRAPGPILIAGRPRLHES